MNTYRQLTNTDRLELAILLRKGYTKEDIAIALDCHRSTIYRELVHANIAGIYDPVKVAHKTKTTLRAVIVLLVGLSGFHWNRAYNHLFYSTQAFAD